MHVRFCKTAARGGHPVRPGVQPDAQPQTNGKVERFNQTMGREWAYARPYRSEAERVTAFPHTYNHHRGHAALKSASPAGRVPNLSGQNS
jgi:transposase InsO family protein